MPSKREIPMKSPDSINFSSKFVLFFVSIKVRFVKYSNKFLFACSVNSGKCESDENGFFIKSSMVFIKENKEVKNG